MAKLSAYNIQLIDLSHGTHHYEFSLGRDFFEDIDGNEVKKGNVKVDLQVIKTGSAYEFKFDIKGVIQIPCSRCLDDMNQQIDTQPRLVVKLGEEYSEESDEVIIVPEDEGEINIAWFLYEFIALNIPIKHIHEFGKCNKEMAVKFREHRAVIKGEEDDEPTDEDIEINDEDIKTDVDPRWDALKGLTFEDN